MDTAQNTLFEYLRNVIYSPQKAKLNVDDLPDDFKTLGSGLKYFAESTLEAKELARALSKGDIVNAFPSRGNEIAAPLKSLHATLKHLTWQAKRIAEGDYNQKIDFMGEFSEAFNSMTEQLAHRQNALENQIEQIKDQAKSLEQGIFVLTALMHLVPLHIIVKSTSSNDIFYKNNSVIEEEKVDADFVKNILQIFSDKCLTVDESAEIEYINKNQTFYFIVKSYSLRWTNEDAIVYLLNDMSETNRKIQALEVEAYTDNLTGLYNRAYGMISINNFINEKKQFVLIFCDLDSLKYVNDVFGHNHGDMYIINAGKHLQTISPDAIVCRLGGDEFMLVAEKMTYNEAHTKMTDIYEAFRSDDDLKDKEYTYSISFGIVEVEPDTKISVGDILSLADERMYENKRQRKLALK